ncbi:ABC transporter ATP-binding protein [Prosthecomicrobium hirschii]|uniref:ABC transporter ATP-binding protein n=1 Tax=Prosthecodimorpha hirschii TaxID=665126 RepID=UPI0009FA9BD3|nr:ABC transporter ATP-binding protein [Prosthecomicrobium hirschii]
MTRPLRQVLAEAQSVPLEIGWLPETKATAPALPPEEPPAVVPRGSGVALDLKGVGKSFGDKRVLGGVDLQVRPGDFLVVVGKSGCGKSTLLRLLVGLDRPTEGEIAIGPGRDGGKANARIVFQEPRLLPWASVLDNVAVGLPASLSSEAAWKAAETVLADVHLQGRADDWPSVLSGGQRQRVALARALVSHPDLLVLDEPLGALDALTRITMQSLIERVWHAQGFTAVLVTHDVAEAVALGDRVVVIDEGRIVLDLAIDLPRPRERGSAALAALEGKLLDAIFGVAEVVY